MTGKTHATVGLGTVLAVTQPSTVSGLVLAAGTGMLGALISDIDVGTSKSHKDADRITLIYDLKDHSYRSKLKKQGIHKASCLTEIQRNAARQRIQDPYPFPVKAVQHQM